MRRAIMTQQKPFTLASKTGAVFPSEGDPNNLEQQSRTLEHRLVLVLCAIWILLGFIVFYALERSSS